MTKSGYVYVMRGADGLVKVGYSNKPERRAKQVGNVIEIAHTSAFLEDAETIERGAHKLLRLAGRHIRAEWFSATVKEAIGAIERAQRIAAGLELALDRRPRRPQSPPDIVLHLPADVVQGLRDLAREDRRTLRNMIDYVLWNAVEASKASERCPSG